MESPLKQRLIGAAVLAALAIIFLPMLLKGPEVKEPDAAQVPLTMPAAPGQQFETHELPLGAPETVTPPGGVLGVPAAAPAPAAPTPAAPAASIATAMPAATPPATAAPAVIAPTPVAPPLPTASAPVAPAPPESAATAAGKYAVNIGSYSKIENANALAAKLRAAKLPVLAEHVKLGQVDALRLRLGPYADRTAAEAARLRADELAGGSSKVIVLDAVADTAPAPKPAVTLPTATLPKPAAPAAAISGFAIQLAAPAKETDAIALRDRARAAGFAAFVQPVDTDAGVRYRVRVGPVADRIAAEQLRDSVNTKLGSKGIIVPHP